MNRLQTSVLILVGALGPLAACADTETSELQQDASFVVTDSGIVADTGTNDPTGGGWGGADGSFIPGSPGGLGGGEDAAVGVDSGTPGGGVDSGSPGGGVGGGYVRGPAPTSASASTAGSFKVMSYTSGYRDGPDFGTGTIWYPTDATPPFALTVVVPGFVSAESDIATWGGFLASHGIVTMTIGTNSGLDQPPARAAALLDALKSLQEENARAASPLSGKLDMTRAALIGWSMGGGGALLAAAQTPSLKAVISLAGWNPGHNYSMVQVPALLFAAQGDTLAGGADQSPNFYNTIPAATPKLLWVAPGEGQLGGHYMFNNPAGVMGTVGRFGLSWLKVFLEGDDRYKQFLPVEPASAVDFQTNVAL